MHKQPDRDGRAFLLLAVLPFGCGSPSSPPAQRAPAAELMSAAEVQSIAARWQGAWVMPFRSGDGAPSPIGSHEVWAVTGARLTRWDGDTEATAAMTFLARCLVKVGGQQFRLHAFAFADGQLIVDDEIGVREGDAITVCTELGGVYTFDGTACRYWKKPFGRRGFAPHPATCKVEEARFEAASADDVTSPHVMQIDGGLVRQEFPREGATRFETLAAAKASLLE